MSDEEEPLTDGERKQLRELLKADARRVWLLSSIKAVSIWIAAIATAWLAFRNAIADILWGG